MPHLSTRNHDIDEIQAAARSAHGSHLDITNARKRQSVTAVIIGQWNWIDIPANNTGVVIETALDSDNLKTIGDRTAVVVPTAQPEGSVQTLPRKPASSA